MRLKVHSLSTLLKVLALVCVNSSYAGYWEFSTNGSYFKRNNGVFNGSQSYTIIQRIGTGIGYNFENDTSIELAYTNSKTVDTFNQLIPSIVNAVATTRTTDYHNLSLSLILQFGAKKATFRPYIRGGLGYMARTTTIKATTKAADSDAMIEVNLGSASNDKSASAEVGTGLKYYISDRVALDLSFTVYGSDIDRKEIFLHYYGAGGLRILF